MIVKPGTFCSSDLGDSWSAGQMLLAVDEQIFVQRIGELGGVAVHDQQQRAHDVEADGLRRIGEQLISLGRSLQVALAQPAREHDRCRGAVQVAHHVLGARRVRRDDVGVLAEQLDERRRHRARCRRRPPVAASARSARRCRGVPG